MNNTTAICSIALSAIALLPARARASHAWLSGDYPTGDSGGKRTELADKGYSFQYTPNDSFRAKLGVSL